MSHDMITLKELLEDDQYKHYFLKPPRLPRHYRGSEPWKLMILKVGEKQWRTKKFATYSEAFLAAKPLMKNPTVFDIVINCPALDFQPPIRVIKGKVKGKFNRDGSPLIVTRAIVWKPQIAADMPTHYWCPYCRRPTKFGYFEVHPAMTKQRVGNRGPSVDPSLLRCHICGASERLIDLRHPANHQNWDVKNRIKVG